MPWSPVAGLYSSCIVFLLSCILLIIIIVYAHVFMVCVYVWGAYSMAQM